MLKSLIINFRQLTRIQTRADFHLFLLVTFLFSLILLIRRIPEIDSKERAFVLGFSLKEKILNIVLDVFLSFLLSTVFFVVLS